MIITIDTKYDSQDEIRKAIDFLQTFMQTANPGLVQPPQQSADIFSMFSSPEAKREETQVSKTTETNEDQIEVEDEYIPQVIPY